LSFGWGLDFANLSLQTIGPVICYIIVRFFLHDDLETVFTLLIVSVVICDPFGA
jgi:hypothetical protein